MFLKKIDHANGGLRTLHAPNDPEFSTLLVGLWEHLASHTYEDGSPRVSSTLLVFIEDGLWKVCLNDRDNGCVAFLSAETHQEALIEIDRRVVEGRLEWRQSKYTPRTKK